MNILDFRTKLKAGLRALRQVAEIHLGSIFAWGKVDAVEIGVKRLLVQITP